MNGNAIGAIAKAAVNGFENIAAIPPSPAALAAPELAAPAPLVKALAAPLPRPDAAFAPLVKALAAPLPRPDAAFAPPPKSPFNNPLPLLSIPIIPPALPPFAPAGSAPIA